MSSDLLCFIANTLVKSGSFPAICELTVSLQSYLVMLLHIQTQEIDSLSDCTVASSPPSTSSAEQAMEPSSSNHSFTHVGRQPQRTKTPPKSTRYATSILNSSQREAVKSPTPIVGSPKTGTGFLRRLKGKSSYTVNS